MSKTTRKPVDVLEIEAEATPNSIVETSRTVMLAALGAAALAREQAQTWFERFIERGETAEGDVRQFAQDLNVKSRKLAKRGLKLTQRNADKGLATMLDQLDLPSKADIETLSRKVTALTHKVEGLQKA